MTEEVEPRQAVSGQGSGEGQAKGQGSEGSQNGKDASGGGGGGTGSGSGGTGSGGVGTGSGGGGTENGGGGTGSGGGGGGDGGKDGDGRDDRQKENNHIDGCSKNSASGASGAKKKKDPSAGKIPDLTPPKALVQKYAIRPAPIPPPPQKVKLENGDYHKLDQKAWMSVFRYLPQSGLLRCSEVCKTWHRWALHHSLWRNMAFPSTHLAQAHLIAIVKRQPVCLDLSWTNISYRKLDWLLARLPHLRHLDLTGCSWAGVCALCSPSCPLLHSLNLSWVTGLISGCVRDLVSPPVEHRPGVDHSLSRLHHCHTLALTGSNVTVSALPVIAQNLPKLATLRLDSCVKLGDDSIETIVRSMSALTTLSISRCHGLTIAVLPLLKSMENLERLEMQNCLKISAEAIEEFAGASGATYDAPNGAILFTKRAHSPMIM